MKTGTISISLPRLVHLPSQTEQELTARHEAEILQLLPLLGPMFGMAVILFSAWDFLIDPMHARLALVVRLSLVFLGSPAYFSARLPWTTSQRCGYLYGTHAGAIIVCEFLLRSGFQYGLAGIVACVFAVSVMTLRWKVFLLILSLPSLLLVILLTISMPMLDLINSLMLYFFSVGLAGAIMLVIRHLRVKAFLFESELLRISRHDSLTGACNRAYLAELAEREIALAKRHGRPLAIAMLDIDYFKRVNDTYGHDTGDKVIQLLVKTCTDNLRAIDHFGRIGGEEFACILPETNDSAAMLCAERLRCSIESLRMQTPAGEIQFTVSIGIAMLAQNHPDWSELLKTADTALYEAKHSGRNRVVMRPPSS